MFQVFHSSNRFVLESGKVLPQLHLGYTTLGTMNAEKSNVVWIFHALTANSNPSEWWPGVVGDGCVINEQQHFIICVNMPGSCYGSINPLTVQQDKSVPYYLNFPLFTTRDMIRAYQLLKTFLGIEKVLLGIGGSMGGQQLLEWAIEEPGLFEHIIPIATNAKHSAWGIAFNSTQRLCIETDATWNSPTEIAGINGMKTARAVALISYRNYATYESQDGVVDEALPVDKQEFKATTYQQYQGEKLAKRFNAYSYWYLSKGMDSHDVGRDRNGVIAALQLIEAKTLVIGVSSDILFPVKEQTILQQHIGNAKLAVIDSYYGHDGFLLEPEKIGSLIKGFLEEELAII